MGGKCVNHLRRWEDRPKETGLTGFIWFMARLLHLCIIEGLHQIKEDGAHLVPRLPSQL